MSDGAEEIRLAAETWAAKRVPLAAKFDTAGLDRFVETNDALARKVIHGLDSQNPDVLSALSELAITGAAILERRKVFVNGQDRTPPR